MSEDSLAAADIVGNSESGLAEKKRRNFLIGATGAIGGVAGVLAVTPFVGSLRPSRKTKIEGAAVKISIAGLIAGELRRAFWRKKPIWLFGRDQAMLDYAGKSSAELADPNSETSLQPAYCQNDARSIKPEVFVAVGLCTHLGCTPAQAVDRKEGFLCACHGSRFDVAGRVVKGSPAPSNLMIPPHYYAGENEIVIGEDNGPA